MFLFSDTILFPRGVLDCVSKLGHVGVGFTGFLHAPVPAPSKFPDKNPTLEQGLEGLMARARNEDVIISPELLPIGTNVI